VKEKTGSLQHLDAKTLTGSVEEESVTCALPVLSRVCSTESCYFEEKESLEAVLDDVALRVFLESTTQAGGELNKQAKNVEQAMRLSSTRSAIFVSQPWAGIVSKNWFHVLMLLATAGVAYRLRNTLAVLSSSRTFAADAVRLRILEVRGGVGLPVWDSKLATFGLLQGGCRSVKKSFESGEGKHNGAGVYRLSAPGVRADGYFFDTAQLHPKLLPASWVVESLNQEGLWVIVGASAWRLLANGQADMLSQLRYTFPFWSSGSADLSTLAVAADMRPDTNWIVMNVVLPVVSGIGTLSCAVLGFAGRFDEYRFVFKCFYCAVSLVWTAAAGSCNWMTGWREVVTSWMKAFVRIIPTIMLVLDYTSVVQFMVSLGLGDILVVFISEALFYKMRWTVVLQVVCTCGLGWAHALFGLSMLYFRRQAVAGAHSITLNDKLCYDAIWAKLCQQEGIFALRNFVKRIEEMLDNSCPPRQFIYQTRKPLAKRRSSISSSFEFGQSLLSGLFVTQGGLPVVCLNQLFVQAKFLQPILLSKVKSWALTSRGCFPLRSEDGFLRYSDAMSCSAQQIKWASLKSANRAVEKLVRVYGQDVSRLLDLCRQSIVFDCVRDLFDCLRLIEADPEILLLRIKNRMDPAYNSQPTGGYRDVSLNLLIGSAFTSQFAVDAHVCEVQLILRPFAELKTNSGHARYVRFRNLRGE